MVAGGFEEGACLVHGEDAGRGGVASGFCDAGGGVVVDQVAVFTPTKKGSHGADVVVAGCGRASA